MDLQWKWRGPAVSSGTLNDVDMREAWPPLPDIIEGQGRIHLEFWMLNLLYADLLYVRKCELDDRMQLDRQVFLTFCPIGAWPISPSSRVVSRRGPFRAGWRRSR